MKGVVLNLEGKNGFISSQLIKKMKILLMESNSIQTKSFFYNQMYFGYQRKQKSLYYNNNSRPCLMSIKKRTVKYIKLDKRCCHCMQKIKQFQKWSLENKAKNEQIVQDQVNYIKNQNRILNNLDAIEVSYDLYKFDGKEAQFEQQEIENEDYNLEYQQRGGLKDKMVDSENH